MQSRATFLFLSMAALTGFGFSDCGGSTPTEPIPPPPNPLACSGLDEQACNARPDCRAEYTDAACACPAVCQIDPNGGENCAPLPCDCPPTTFDSCVAVGPCEGLDQASCQSDPSCNWLIADRAADLAAPCICPACDAADPTLCPPCDCGGGGVPPPPGICVPADPCRDLDEAQCNSTQGCEPIYGQSGCGAPTDPNGAGRAAPCEGPDCFACEPTTTFLGCQVEGPSCPPVCDLYCPYGNQIDPNGCELCACNPGPNDCYSLDEQACNADPSCQAQYEAQGCDVPFCEVGPNGEEVCYPCDPVVVFTGCTPRIPEGCFGLDEQACNADPSCQPIYAGTVCDAACETGPNGEEICYPCDPVVVFQGCVPAGGGEGCTSDDQCPNGYCERFDGTGLRAPPCDQGGNCDPAPPPPGGQCVYPSCDDGQPTMCDALPPECGPGMVSAARNGCFECVDARTCGNEPPPPVCNDGPVSCFAFPMDCPAGTELGVKDGCWACVEPTTCQEVGCHDGSEILCRALPPICGPNQTLGVQNACWACLDPNTCQ